VQRVASGQNEDGNHDAVRPQLLAKREPFAVGEAAIDDDELDSGLDAAPPPRACGMFDDDLMLRTQQPLDGGGAGPIVLDD
jgi:hypothetical protein